MRICAFSDMHGKYNFEVKPCDVTLICGDIVPLNIQWNINKSIEWFENFFLPWCTNLPCEKVLFIGGNHDKFLADSSQRVREILSKQDKVVYLECETYEYQGKISYGTPLCKIFYNWSFMETQEKQNSIYEKAAKEIEKIDIMITHDCPYGVNDVLLQEDCPWAHGDNIGNQALRAFLDAMEPSFLFDGHLHSAEHNKTLHGKTSVYNVSLLDENYNMTYEPLYLEIS